MKKQEEQQKISPLAIIAFGLLIVAVVAFALVTKKQNGNQQEASKAEQTPPATAPPETRTSSDPETHAASFRMPPFLSDPSIATLDPIKDPATVSPAAQSSYEVAQSKPLLLAQLPCFCYCDRFGHGSLHDCFVTNHAETCDICMKEALQADQMDRQGMAPLEIREAIIAQYHPKNEDHSGHNH